MVPLKTQIDQDNYDWEFKIQMLEGGIIRTTEDSGTIAPDSGYSSTANIGYKHDEDSFLSGETMHGFYSNW